VKRHWEPAPEPDARLDPYRKAAARLYDGDSLAAPLLTRVDVWWTTEGRGWNRRNVRPQERVAWLLDFAPGFEGAHPSGWDDGVDVDVAELDDDRFTYVGRTLRVEWLTGPEAEEQFALHGWERHD
jgi:hypothetical protein